MIVGVVVSVDGDGDGDVAVSGSPTQLCQHRHDPFEKCVGVLLRPDVDGFQHQQKELDGTPVTSSL